MAITRSAHVVWDGDLMSGSGAVSATTSGAFDGVPVSWKTRSAEGDANASPEELVAAAHASCFAMAFSAALGGRGAPPGHLEVDATVTFEKVENGWKVASSALKVVGQVEGIDADGFREAAEGAKNGCPISAMMTGNVDLSVEASLA